MGRVNYGIRGQFWNIKEPEFETPELNIEIVKEMPEKIYKKADLALAWAFLAGPEKLTLRGFPLKGGGEFTEIINKMYVTINRYGIFQEILAHNYSFAYILKLDMSAARLSFLLQILKYDGDMYFDPDNLKDYIADMAAEQGLVNFENQDEDEPYHPFDNDNWCHDSDMESRG